MRPHSYGPEWPPSTPHLPSHRRRVGQLLIDKTLKVAARTCAFTGLVYALYAVWQLLVLTGRVR